MANISENTRKKLIIDTDCGADDAQAIVLALSKEYVNYVDVLGITCASGNVAVDKVVPNVLKTLEACERTDIPVYKGATTSLLAHDRDASHFHGKDGLCDLNHTLQPNMASLKNEKAVDYLIRIARENPKEITLIAIGPLTNLALAHKIDPMFSENLKIVSIMGGNIHGRGNVTTCAEFNFHFDPESAHIVLNEFACPIEIVAWETCLGIALNSEFLMVYGNQKTKKGEFLGPITNATVKSHVEVVGGEFVTCDPLAVAAVLEPNIVLKYEDVYATVELEGRHTRGQMVIDWKGLLRKKNNAKIIIEMDSERFKSMLLGSVQ